MNDEKTTGTGKPDVTDFMPPIVGHNPSPDLPTKCPTCLSVEVSLVTYRQQVNFKPDPNSPEHPVGNSYHAIYFCRACKTGFTKPYRYAKDAK